MLFRERAPLVVGVVGWVVGFVVTVVGLVGVLALVTVLLLFLVVVGAPLAKKNLKFCVKSFEEYVQWCPIKVRAALLAPILPRVMKKGESKEGSSHFDENLSI